MGGAKMTQKINSILEQAGALPRFVATIITTLGLIGTVIFLPVNTRISNLEHQVIELKQDAKEKIDKKADNNLVEVKLKAVDDKLYDIGKKLDRIEGWFMKGGRP